MLLKTNHKFPLAPLKLLVMVLKAEFGPSQIEKTTTPSVPQCHTTTNERQAAAGREGDRREEKERVFPHIHGALYRRRGGEVTDRKLLEDGYKPGSGAHRQKAGQNGAQEEHGE